MATHNDLLTKYTALAKDIIYDEDRMRKFMKMLGTSDGALIAVHTVLGAIEQAKPIPPQIAKNLGVNAYLVLVDMAQQITGQEASPKIMKQVINAILSEVTRTHPDQPQQPEQPKQAMGLINQGAAA